MPTTPSPEFQLEFLDYIQSIFDAGAFSATYKFALLMALADLSVEIGDDSGAPLRLEAETIASKFIAYYYHQTRPFVGKASTGILYQNNASQANIVRCLAETRGATAGHAARASAAQVAADRNLLNVVRKTVINEPLWKLQKIAKIPDHRIYHQCGTRGEIEMHEGVAFCFRRFHPFITRMAQDRWIRFVSECKKNKSILGDQDDIGDFLFGTRRNSLEQYAKILDQLQKGKCFYCAESSDNADVDHFIPWSHYRLDLGHNFVLACRRCNSSKADSLAAAPHLRNWIRRNNEFSDHLQAAFAARAISHNIVGTYAIARWAYSRVAAAQGATWFAPGDYRILSDDLESAFST